VAEPSDRADDLELYCEYGRTMRAAQTFEYTVRQLVSLNDPLQHGEDRPAVEIDAEVDRFFKRPLAKLAKLRVEEDFASELEAAVSTRNTLAHHYFITAFLELNVGLASHRDLISTLIEARHRYDDVNARLSAIVDRRHKELGVNPSEAFDTAEEMRRAMLGDESRPGPPVDGS
jgi:hypothetical protein